MAKQWQDKERKDAKLFGSKGTPRSGGLWFAKGDSRSKTLLVENKTTAKESFSITEKVWTKIEHEALLDSRIPILSIEFAKKKIELIILSKDDFLVMLEKYEH